MSLKFNDNTPNKIKFNGNNVAKVIFNNVVVWVAKILNRVSGTSPITLDGSTGDIMQSATINGKTEQKTTTGKNLFNVNTYTVFPYYIKISGESASLNTVANRSIIIPITGGKTYTYYNSEYVSVADIRIGTIAEEPSDGLQLLEFKSAFTTNTITLQTSENAKYLIVQGVTNSDNRTMTTIVNTAMIVEGSTVPTSYEPYTNGASPNPDYPQEIKNIKGNITLKIHGKNLFKNWITGYAYNSDTGKVTTRTTSSISDYMEIDLKNGAVLSNLPTGGNIYVSAFDSDLKYIARTAGMNALNRTISIASFNNTGSGTGQTSKIKYIALTYLNTDTREDTQVEEGTTQTSYEPYTENQVYINLQDNELCKIGDIVDKLLIDKNGNVAIEKNIGKNTSYNGETYNYYMSSTARKDGTYESGELQLNQVVYHELETPEIIPLPNIQPLQLSKGTNYVTVEANLEPIDIEVEYYKGGF